MHPIAPWDTLESDPAIFTSLLASLGVKDTEVIEIVSLDELTSQTIPGVRDVHGLIFLFKYLPTQQAPPTHPSTDSSEIYFAQQTAQNACATQALVNLLLNMRETVDVGPTLSDFHAMTSALDPTTRGDAIAQHEVMCTVHNSYSPYFAIRSKLAEAHAGSSKDAYHFVTFFHSRGALWELDGLRPAPIRHTVCEASQWLSTASELLSERIAAISAQDQSGIGFSLQAVVRDRVSVLRETMTSDAASTEMYASEIEAIQRTRAAEKIECVRRKHNFLPTISALLRAMAAKGDLQKAIDRHTSTV